MKLTKSFRLIGQALAVTMLTGTTLAGDVLPILKVGSDTYSNVVVLNVTDTELFFQHAGVMSNVKLADLDPALQRTFGYVPPKPQPLETTTQPATVPQTLAVANTASENVSPERKRAIPEGKMFKDYPLADGKALRLIFPNVWTSSDPGPAAKPPYSTLIRMEHDQSGSFMSLITVMPTGNPFEKISTQQALSISGYNQLKDSVETTLNLEPLNGVQAQGLYYSLTLKKPGKRLPCQTQGLVKFGDLMVYFVFESSDARGKDAQAAMEMIRNAELVEKP